MNALRRRTFWIVGLLVVTLGGAAYIHYTHAQGQPEFTFDSAPVDRGKIVDRVTASGTLSAQQRVQADYNLASARAQLMRALGEE